jgi:predicted HTH domain antitoxin
MCLFIPDDILKQAGITDSEAKIELACRLYDTDRLDLWPAAQLAGLSRVEFEIELAKRGLPLIHYSHEDFEQDMRSLEHLRAVQENEKKQKES